MQITCPEVFRPLWQLNARYKGAHGGRGSGKSHDRAAACVVNMLQGRKIVGLREVQRSIRDSVKTLVEDKISEMGLDGEFRLLRDEIICESSGAGMIFRGLQDHTAESIKSLEGFDVAWVEEAQTITQRSLTLLTPTIRTPGSELWFTWNPRFKTDPVDMLLRGPEPPSGSVVVQANWSDNPFFPDDLRGDMERDRRLDIELYNHVWGGAYQRIGEGAYYAKELAAAYADGRVCSVPVDPNYPITTAWDIGLDDFTAIWVCQPVGREVRIVDYYQNNNRDAAYYAKWVRDNGYDTGLTLLPHDAGAREKGSGRTYESYLREAGLIRTKVLERTRNQMTDIQSVRTFIAKCVFDDRRKKREETDGPFAYRGVPDGMEILGMYRVKMDEKLNIPLPKPIKDGTDHCADAFRTLAAGQMYLKSGAPWDTEVNPNLIVHGRNRQATRAGRLGPRV